MEDKENLEVIETTSEIVEETPIEEPVEESKPKSKRQLKKERKKADKPGDPYKGRAAYKWFKFFFILFCIALGLVVLGFALPLLLTIIGVFSFLMWLLFIIFGTIFTIGLMWTDDGVKKFFSDWNNASTKLMDMTNNSYALAGKVLPPIIIAGCVLFIICWIFVLAGYNKDIERKPKYKKFLIALGIVTGIFVLAAIGMLILILNVK